MTPAIIILVVGLTPRLIGSHTPHLKSLAEHGALRPLATVLPALTCTVQATLLTGAPPSVHGAVANGWFFRDLAEPWLWRQSHHLIAGEKIWEAARRRDPQFTCAQMFWWYNMHSSVDWSATPRPIYTADGRKIPDHYTYPPNLHDELDAKLGPFPLFKFWGPAADIVSSRWIARATLHVMRTRNPTLTFCYLPHLDYNLQRLGPDPGDRRLAKDLEEVDALCGELIEAALRTGRDVIVVSEYGMMRASDAVHINRALRQAGFIVVRNELGREVLDAGASAAFALSDHQVAHVYIRSPDHVGPVAAVLRELEGVDMVLDGDGKRRAGLDHPRSGELVAISKPDRWFSYYYWLDAARAPDFASTVDIHRKPGYDPVELFIDPAIRFPSLAIGWRLLKRKLGMRALMDVISASDTRLVRGTHGRLIDDPADGPLVITSRPDLLPEPVVLATSFKQLVLRHVFA